MMIGLIILASMIIPFIVGLFFIKRPAKSSRQLEFERLLAIYDLKTIEHNINKEKTCKQKTIQKLC